MVKVDLNKSIENLENVSWGTIPKDASGLIKSCYELRRKKIKDLDENELRIALGQNIGLDYIVPLVLDTLKKNPLFEALYYEGDLLKNLLSIDNGFWQKNKPLKDVTISIVNQARKELNFIDTTDDIREELTKSFDFFLHKV